MTPLDYLASRRIDGGAQWHARLAICRATLGVAPGATIGPKWRKGSNNIPRGLTIDVLTRSSEPCRECGAEGGDMLAATVGNVGFEFCPSCGAQLLVGDYDWNSLADCHRFVADEAAGLIDDGAIHCPGCGGDAADFETAEALRDHCSSERCFLKLTEAQDA